jgi:hypothetical protein
MNTPQKGTVRCIVFKDQDAWYGVGLEFNIVETADDPDVAMLNLQEAIRGYVESYKMIKGTHGFQPLNQKAEKEYEDLWQNLTTSQPIPSPYEVHYYGVTNVHA